jgi:hypothetical protein
MIAYRQVNGMTIVSMTSYVSKKYKVFPQPPTNHIDHLYLFSKTMIMLFFSDC